MKRAVLPLLLGFIPMALRTAPPLPAGRPVVGGALESAGSTLRREWPR